MLLMIIQFSTPVVERLLLKNLWKAQRLVWRRLLLMGDVHVIQITDKLTTGAPYFVEMGHSQPSQLSEDKGKD